MAPQGKQCTEIGVRLHEDTFFCHGSGEDHRILFGLKIDFPHVHGMETRAPQCVGNQWRKNVDSTLLHLRLALRPDLSRPTVK
jgi:hypothetical protein